MTWPSRFNFKNRGNDQWLELGPLEDGLTVSNPAPTYINDATVTAQLFQDRVIGDDTRLGTLVATFGTLSLPYVASSNGIYRGLLAETFLAPAGTNYVLVFTI